MSAGWNQYWIPVCQFGGSMSIASIAYARACATVGMSLGLILRRDPAIGGIITTTGETRQRRSRTPATATCCAIGIALTGTRAIGRIFRSSSAPQDRPWMWTITGAVVAPRLSSHGFCATLDDAKAAFATT
jgi:hypothetical protein